MNPKARSHTASVGGMTIICLEENELRGSLLYGPILVLSHIQLYSKASPGEYLHLSFSNNSVQDS